MTNPAKPRRAPVKKTAKNESTEKVKRDTQGKFKK